MAGRWVAGFVLLCVLVQALLIPAQRIHERTHFHLSSSGRGSSIWTIPTSTSTATSTLKPSQSVARAVFAHRRDVAPEVAHDAAHHEALPHHQHAALQDHEHGPRADVVYVRDQEAPSASHPAASAKRLVLDQDGLSAPSLAVLVITVARVAHIKSSAPVSTRNELPLERPPRV